MNTWKRANHVVFKTDKQRNCPHLDEWIVPSSIGGIKLAGGEIYDTIEERDVCKMCGLEVEMVDPTPTEMDRYISHEYGWA